MAIAEFDNRTHWSSMTEKRRRVTANRIELAAGLLVVVTIAGWLVFALVDQAQQTKKANVLLQLRTEYMKTNVLLQEEQCRLLIDITKDEPRLRELCEQLRKRMEAAR